MKLFIHGKAATPVQADLRIASPPSGQVPGELHGSATDWASMHLFASIVNRCEDAIISATIIYPLNSRDYAIHLARIIREA